MKKQINKNKLQKFIKILVFVVIIFAAPLFLGAKTQAFSINELSDQKISDDQIVFRIYATPVDKNQNAVSIYLNAKDLEIVNFTPSQGGNWLSVIGECGDSKTFTTDRICVSMAKTSGIVNDEVLGDVTVKFKDSSTNSGSLVLAEGCGYANSKNFSPLETGKEFAIKLEDKRSNTTTQNSITFSLLIVLLAFSLVIMLILSFFSSFRNRVF